MKKYKQSRKLVEVKCENCGILYKKPASEYKRNLKLNRKNYCSRSCVGKQNHTHLNIYKGNVQSLISTNKIDKYTPYRYYLKSVRRRSKEYNITLNDLHEQWVIQKGICPYSGIKLILSTHSKIERSPIYSASLDRIDSKKGYIKGNIQFTSRSLNYLKGELSHKETIKLCKIISQHYK